MSAMSGSQHSRHLEGHGHRMRDFRTFYVGYGFNDAEDVKDNADQGTLLTSADYDGNSHYEGTKLEDDTNTTTPPSLKVLALESLVSSRKQTGLGVIEHRLLLLYTLNSIYHDEADPRECEAVKTIDKMFYSIYPVLASHMSREDIAELVGPERLSVAEEDARRLSQTRKNKADALSGGVLDREKVVLTTEELAAGQNPPKGGHSSKKQYYPPRALYRGVQWPEEVDPKRREDWLSDEDFLTVFGISRSEYLKLDKYKVLQLKKDKNMF